MAVEFNNHAAFAYIAKENGWYEETGLGITSYESYSTGMMLSSALARDDIQVAYICLAPALLSYAQGVPIRIVAGCHKYGFGFVVQPDIDSLQDLEGKTIGCVREGGMTDILLNRLISNHNLADINIQRMTPQKQILALSTGQLDAALLPEHQATLAESMGFNIILSSNDLWPDLQGSVLVVKSDLIEKETGTVQELVNVTQRASIWLADYPKEAADLVAKELDTDADVVLKSMNRLEYTTDLNQTSIQEMIDYMVDLDYIDEGRIEIEHILDLSFLERI
ncbi:MAG: ABC transporter substrate-binding protein [Chloroflexota bacterium]|nr:ABC transporter substrate-binding protein [Chloroflexota bacterium]